MSERIYKAALSQSQGRDGWSVIFRHPVLLDRATSKPGRRVRRGLGTREQEVAESLVSQLNDILSDRQYWGIGSRSTAEARFNQKVVEIFYQDISPEPVDAFEERNKIIPLPSSETSDYRRVVFIGTTGSGKTTLARQLIGTNPINERFPSTSTAKTTVADTEILLTDGQFKAVVTFMPRDQVLDYVDECMSSAVLAAYNKEADEVILHRLLNHVNQRFRLSYILGSGELDDDPDEDDFDEVTATGERDDVELTFLNTGETNLILRSTVKRLRGIANKHADTLREELKPNQDEERTFEELFEECLDSQLRNDEEFQAIADELMDEIEKRFEILTVGETEKTKQGWLKSWKWESDNRAEFLKIISRFSSNYAPYFGTLLTPLVNGLRVAGPFQPEWCDFQPKLVLFDVEGLGHTPDSSASMPTSLTRRIDDVDAVLLVDNATQPMQAAPVAAMKSLVSSGKASKLIVCFTHFDGVVGDNIPRFRQKEKHVVASAENVLTSIGEQLGNFAERALRKRLQTACFFLGRIHHNLSQEMKHEARTIKQLRSLLKTIEDIVEKPEPVESKPVYDQTNLVLAVKQATEDFHSAWRARLGLQVNPNFSKEHWARVKALSRRLALGWKDEYDHLKPVADLHKELQERIYVFIQNPIDWTGGILGDDAKQQVFDDFAEKISAKILDVAGRRLWMEQIQRWQNAYGKAGSGSTFERAKIIAGEIYEKAAPIPDVVPSPDKNRFLHEVSDIVRQTAEECSIKLR